MLVYELYIFYVPTKKESSMNRYLFMLFFTLNFALSPLLVNAANAVVHAAKPKAITLVKASVGIANRAASPKATIKALATSPKPWSNETVPHLFGVNNVAAQTAAPGSNDQIENETDPESDPESDDESDENGGIEAKVTPFPEQPKPITRSPRQSPKGSSRRPSISLLVTTPSEENKELVESKTVGEELRIASEQPQPISFLNTPLISPKNDALPEITPAVAIEKTDRKKAPLGATWWCGTRRGRIKHAFETYPDSPRSNTYREELRGLQEIEQDATERSLVLKVSRPELITADNIDRKILDRIINGCTTLDVALNPTVFFQIWEVSKQLKDQQIHYVDTHSLALIQDCLEKLAHFMGDRNPLTADMTRSQRAANALCKGVNYDPENESDDENSPWGPEEIFNCSKMKKPVSIKIPGSDDTLELLVTFKKAKKPVVEQSALEFKE